MIMNIRWYPNISSNGFDILINNLSIILFVGIHSNAIPNQFVYICKLNFYFYFSENK